MNIIAIYGPSGAGKTTIINIIKAKYHKHVKFTTSHTTRQPRKTEVDKVNYHFTDKQHFLKLMSENKFIETSVFLNNYYGTSFKAINDIIKTKQICILDLDLNGINSIKSVYPNATCIHITASFETLQQRLTKRGDTPDSIKNRLHQFIIDQQHLETTPSPFTETIINDNNDLNKSLKKIENIIKKKLNL